MAGLIDISSLAPNLRNPAETKLKLVESAASSAHGKATTARKVPHKQVAELSDADQVQISKLKARDTQVKQHEQAHLSAAGGLSISGANLTYQKGPNGVNYAVGGDVKIDTSPGRNAADTLAKAEQIIDAALAPADPSPTDRSVAAKAQFMAQEARTELLQQAKEPPPPAVHLQNPAQAYENGAPQKSNIDTFA
jgi:hypothetical protein